MKVLFVCTGNAHRSPLAEALLKKLRPELSVESAGVHIAIPIAKEVKEYLAKENALEYLKNFPESLENKPLREFDIIVAMEQRHRDYILSRCPQCEDKIVVWNIEDPYFLPRREAEKIYEKIKAKVMELANSF